MNQDDDNTDQYQHPETIEGNVEIIEMKRRLTLVTADEPIPLNDEDMKKHPSIIEDIPAAEGKKFSKTVFHFKIVPKLGSIVIFSDKEFLITPNTSTDEQIKDISSEEEPFDDDSISNEIDMNEEKELGSEEEILSSEDDDINDYGSSETSDIDDSDLLKRLDEKYGKLPQHSDTDDIDNDPTWTSK